MRFIDSNVFYYHLLSDRAYGPKASNIIGKVRSGEEGATSVIAVSELVSLFEFRMLQARKHKEMSEEEKERTIRRYEDAVKGLFELLTSLIHLRKLDCSWRDEVEAFDCRANYGLEFNDSVNLAIMKRIHIKEIYSFDKGFDIVPWLKRRQG